MKTASDVLERARELLATFTSLSPVQAHHARDRLLALAPELGAGFMPELTAFAADLVRRYLTCPVKCNERRIMEDYLTFLDQAAGRLLASGDLSSAPRDTSPRPQSLALVPRDLYTSRDWCTLTEKSDMPLLMSNAVDAARRRNYLVESVLEPVFEFMLAVDAEGAYAWQLGLCRDGAEAADADVARDLIRVWRQQPELPAEVLRQVLAWSEDDRAFRHWPAVIEEADRLLRSHAMACLAGQLPEHSQLSAEMTHLRPFRDNRRLNRWLRRTIDRMGASIDFFVKLSDRDGDLEAWQQDALVRELLFLEQIMPALLLASDLLLLLPTGSKDFAMAVFGFTNDNERRWEDALEEQSRKVIRKLFLDDLKAQRSPVATIHRLCFGNGELEHNILQELDYLSHNFDSVRQRELVVDKLCGIYSSYRKQPLLNTELGRRYRRMMRVLHEDNLRRVLRTEQFAELDASRQVLVDLGTIASESRRFLSTRRALDRSTSEVIAADMDFTQTIRNLRASYVRQLLRL